MHCRNRLNTALARCEWDCLLELAYQIGGKAAKKPRSREWLLLQLCGSSQAFA